MQSYTSSKVFLDVPKIRTKMLLTRHSAGIASGILLSADTRNPTGTVITNNIAIKIPIPASRRVWTGRLMSVSSRRMVRAMRWIMVENHCEVGGVSD